jgi:hypothetical protein
MRRFAAKLVKRIRDVVRALALHQTYSLGGQRVSPPVTELQNDASGNEYDKTVDLCDDCRPSRRHRFLSAGAVAL